MQKQSPLRKFMALLSLGYMGGTIYLTTYLKATFYTQLLDTMNMTNTQLGLVTTIVNSTALILSVPGAYLSDKFDAKKIIVFSVTGVTVLAFMFPLFVRNFATFSVFQCVNGLVTVAYWPSLVKYINNLGGEEEAGSSFGSYYLINGLSGALGNALPLWITTHFSGNPINTTVIAMGTITLIATVLVVIFLDSEKKLAERGIYLKGEEQEPIKIKYIPYILKWPGTYILFFAYGTTILLYEYMSYLNPYLTDVFGMSVEMSSAFSIIRQYGTLVLAPLGGIMADKVLKATYKWYITAFAITGVLYASLIFLFGPDSNAMIVGIYTILPAGVSMALYSVTFSIIRELHIPAAVSGTTIGIATLSETIVPMILTPIFGSFIDNNEGAVGYRYIFAAMVVICVLGILNAM